MCICLFSHHRSQYHWQKILRWSNLEGGSRPLVSSKASKTTLRPETRHPGRREHNLRACSCGPSVHRFHPIGASLVVKLLSPSSDLFALVFAKCSSLKLDNSVASETSPRKVAFPRPTSGTQYPATIETSACHAIHWRHARGAVAHFRNSPSYLD